eukprot:5911688-Alexandrium_andersonii.AAC.1
MEEALVPRLVSPHSLMIAIAPPLRLRFGCDCYFGSAASIACESAREIDIVAIAIEIAAATAAAFGCSRACCLLALAFAIA